MSTQVHFYNPGGFCVHKIKGTFKGHASAFFGIDGKLSDVEIFNAVGNRAVKRNGPVWQEIEKAGIAAARAAQRNKIVINDFEIDILERMITKLSKEHSWRRNYAEITLPLVCKPQFTFGHTSSTISSGKFIPSTVESVNKQILAVLAMGAANIPERQKEIIGLMSKIQDAIQK